MSEQKFTVITSEQESEILKAIKPFEFQYVYRALEVKLKSRLLHDMLELAKVGVQISTSIDVKAQKELIKVLKGVVSDSVTTEDAPVDDVEQTDDAPKDLGEGASEGADGAPKDESEQTEDEPIDEKIGDDTDGVELSGVPVDDAPKDETDAPVVETEQSEDLGEGAELGAVPADDAPKDETEQTDDAPKDETDAPVVEEKPVAKKAAAKKAPKAKKGGDFESLSDAAKPE